MRALIVGLWCVSAAAFAGTSDIGPPPPGHWAKDTTGKITPATLRVLDSICEGVNKTGEGQLGVLVVNTTSGKLPRTFATEVFNQWGVGHREYDNGILLFVALADRKAEIILGDGLLSRISTGDTDAVMRNQVVSNFKAGRPEQALLDGATALGELLTAAHVAATPARVLSQEDARAEAHVAELFRLGHIDDPSPRKWVIDLTGEVLPDTVHQLERLPNELYASDGRQLFIVFFRSTTFTAFQVRERALASLSPRHPRAALLAVNLAQPDASFVFPADLHADSRSVALESEIENAAKFPPELGNVIESNVRAAPVLINGFPPRAMSEVVGEAYEQHGTGMMGFGGALLLGGMFWGRRWNRYRSRSCETCHRPRQMLPAGAEDKHLNAGQQAEQSVKSVDYDVWWCGLCRTVLVRDNSAWFSGYSRCTGCRNKTLRSTTTTLQHATEYSGGLVQIDERCTHCNYSNTYTRSTARLSSSSDSSSSSSSGSSFGGGSSSGSGSSGSW